MFTAHPISISSNTTGGPLEISGCQIQSQIPLDEKVEIFYLINNVKQIKSRIFYGTGHLQYSITSYKRQTTSYEDQGFYQCGITINGPSISRTIFSKTTDVQFSGL